MEVGERHQVAVGQGRQILLAGQQPLLDRCSHAEKTTTDEALHTLEGDVRAAPRIHWKMTAGGCKLDSGWDADVGSLGDWRQRL